MGTMAVWAEYWCTDPFSDSSDNEVEAGVCMPEWYQRNSYLETKLALHLNQLIRYHRGELGHKAICLRCQTTADCNTIKASAN